MTIKDIARIAGVTHSTVSRSLNGSNLVSSDTKERIQRIAREVGYSPNASARRLVRGQGSTIGVFFLSRDEISLVENFGTQFLDGIARESQKNDYDIILFTMTRTPVIQKDYIELCREKGVEGAIFIGVSSLDSHLSGLGDSELPVCMIDYRLSGRNLGFVTSDSYCGITSALDHLYSYGHRDIGFITGPATAPIANERLGAFTEWMKAKNLFREELIYPGDFSKESGFETGQRILAETFRPTGILSANDYMALGALKAFRRGGLRVPQDISLVGYDNAAAGDFSDPGLTTVGQDALEMGAMAARFVFDRLQGKKPLQEIFLTPSLVIRESVARPCR